MEQLINQYSFLWMGGAIVLFLTFLLFRGKPKIKNTIVLIALVVALVMTWLYFHPTQTPLIGNAQEVQSMIGAGTPILLEFQSPY